MSGEARELSIVAVLRHYADVLRHGETVTIPEGTGWRTMKCPFHGDEHASGRVNTELNAFKCNACPMRGDALKLIELQENIKRGEAVEFAGKVLGQSVENIQRAVPKSKKRRPLGREKWKTILE